MTDPFLHPYAEHVRNVGPGPGHAAAEPEPMTWSTAVQVHALAVGPAMLPAARRAVEEKVADADHAAGRAPSVHDPAACPIPPCTTRRYDAERDLHTAPLRTARGPLTVVEAERIRERFLRPAFEPPVIPSGGTMRVAPVGTDPADKDAWREVGVGTAGWSPGDDTNAAVIYHADGGTTVTTRGRHGTILGVLATDGTSLTVWEPLADGDTARMTIRPRPPRVWTAADLIARVEKVRDSVHERPLDDVRLRRWALPAGRVLTVQVNAGPPTWWLPRARASREGWSVGWLRRLVIVDVSRGDAP